MKSDVILFGMDKGKMSCHLHGAAALAGLLFGSLLSTINIRKNPPQKHKCFARVFGLDLESGSTGVVSSEKHEVSEGSVECLYESISIYICENICEYICIYGAPPPKIYLFKLFLS